MTGREARRRGWWERYGAWHMTKFPTLGEASVYPKDNGTFYYEWEVGCMRQGGPADSLGEAIDICERALGIAPGEE